MATALKLMSSRIVRISVLVALPALVFFTPGGLPSALAVLAGYAVVLAGFWLLVTRRRRRAHPAQPAVGQDYLAPLSLPPAPPFLFGRVQDLAKLGDARTRDLPAAGPRVIAIHGRAGIGKTALALRFAHQVADRYPDGQLFTRLKAGATGGATTEAEVDGLVHAVRTSFIRALSRPEDGPADAVASARRYAELTGEDRQILVVLDDAPSAEAARRLLPKGRDCLVLVTSRERLAGLDAVYDHPLEALAQEPAMQTLRALIGSRIALDEGSAEAGAAERIVDATSHQPLALQLVGGMLAERPQWSLRPVVRLLDEGSTGHPRPLDTVYLLLTAEEQRAVKLLGLFPDQSFAPWMLAALMGDIGEDDAGRIVERLVRAGMVERVDRDVAGVAEYRVLEDVQAYALERLTQEAAEQLPLLREALRSARERRLAGGPALAVLDDPLILLDNGRITAALTAARGAVAAARAGADRAAEGHALSVLAELQAEVGWVQAAGELARAAEEAAKELAGDDPVTAARAARCLSRVMRARQDFKGALAQADRALRLLDEARTAHRDDPAERIRALRHRATTLARMGRYDQAGRDLTEAEALGGGCDPPVRASLGVAWGVVRRRAGDPAGALDRLRQAEEQAIEDQQPLWRGWAVFNQARAERELRSYDRALELARESLDLFGEMTHRYGKAYARAEVASIYLDRRDLDAAATALETALKTFRSCGDRWIEAQTLRQLAGVWSAQNRRLDNVATMLREAARLFREAGDAPSAEAVDRQRWVLRLRRLWILPTLVVPETNPH